MNRLQELNELNELHGDRMAILQPQRRGCFKTSAKFNEWSFEAQRLSQNVTLRHESETFKDPGKLSSETGVGVNAHPTPKGKSKWMT